jgi:enediyne biosynthesis protein E4
MEMPMLRFSILVTVCLSAAAELAASGFVCAGYPPPEIPSAGVAKPVYPPRQPLSRHRVEALVILAKFLQEDPANLHAPWYATDLFNPDLPGSLTHFYRTMSFGQFTLVGTVLPRYYDSSHPAFSYLSARPGEKGQYGRFVEEILRKVDADTDLGQFDNDGPDGLPNSGDDDGWVDYLFVNVRSAPRGFIKGPATGIVGLGLNAPYVSGDISANGGYIHVGGNPTQGMIGQAGTFAQTVGTMAHEFGHSLGLPDLYDLDYEDPATDSAGIGCWGLMGWGAGGWNDNDGPNPFCAWSLKQLGWIGHGNDRLVNVVDDETGLVAEDLFAGGAVYRIPLRVQSLDGYKIWEEYLLLERRTRAGTYYNRKLPGEGVLIWHIRARSPYNNDERRKSVDLVCADGLYLDTDLPDGRRYDGKHGGDNLDHWAHDPTYARSHDGNRGDASDPFDGIRYTRFSPSTNPSSDPQALLPAASTGLTLEIQRQGTDMRVHVSQPRWAGEIQEEVHWTGQVLVDGDIRVMPEGRLVIHPDTRVRFAGSDRLRQGADPGLCELHIQGAWFIRQASYTAPSSQVTFEAWHPGESWYGILIDPATWIGNPFPDTDRYSLHDSEHGMQLPAQEHSVLLLLDQRYTAPERENVLKACDDALRSLDLKALVQDRTKSGTKGISDALLTSFLDDDKLVVWLGETMDRATQEAFQRFLKMGGRLFLISRRLPYSNDIDAFLHDEIHAAVSTQARPGAEARIRSTDILSGAPLDFSVSRTPLQVTAPAMPLLLDEHNQVAGLRLDTGTYQLIYLPFELQLMDRSSIRQVLRAALPLLFPEPASRVALEAPESQVLDHKILVFSEQPVLPLQLQVDDGIEGATLLVYSLPGMERLAETPMTEIAPRRFAAEYRPLPYGRYLLWPRLQGTEGQLYHGTQSLQVRAFLFPEKRPVLILLDDATQGQETVVTELQEALQAQSLQANVLQLDASESFLYSVLLERYLGTDKGVIRLGHALDEHAQEAFRGFLERGGRLLMSALSLSRSPSQDYPLQDILHIHQTGKTEREHFLAADHSPYRQFHLLYRPLTLREPAVPVVTDQHGGIAGLQLDTGVYRVIYLSFYLKYMEHHTRQELLKAALAFLWEPHAQELDLQVRSVYAPTSVLPVQPLIPRIVIVNAGESMTNPFQIGYQILRGNQPLFAAAQQEHPLASGAEREIHLPEWVPTTAEELRIRFGWGISAADSLTYRSSRLLHLVEARAPFAEVPLPDQVSAGSGAGFFDYDGDGDLDLYLIRLGAANQLLRNDNARFSEHAQEAGIADPGRGRGLALGDYDGDGDLDLYLVNEGPNHLFRNQGHGAFADLPPASTGYAATEPSLADAGSGRSAGFLDYDNDGDLDLYLVNTDGPNRLFHNESGDFVEQGAAQGLGDPGDGRGLALGDYDADGDIDLFVANQSSPSRLYQNDGGVFTIDNQYQDQEGREAAPVFGDYDNDGDIDLFISSETHSNHLYRNDESGLLPRSTGQDGPDLGAQSVGAAFLDYDNDGDLDLAVTSLNSAAGGDQLYQNCGNEVLIPVGKLLGMRSASDGRGLSFADYDDDGDLDLFVTDYRRSHFYRNTTDSQHWLHVDLKGLPLNRNALGGRVELRVDERQQYREVQSSYGYGSQVQPQVHFGLGQTRRIDSLRVIWPDGQESSATDIRVDQWLTLAHPQYTTAIETGALALPGGFALEQNYPNPFNSQTTLTYRLPQKGRAKLTIYSIAGQLVRQLVNEVQPAGRYQIRWDGTDEKGRRVSSAVYLAKLQVGDNAGEIRKVVMAK